MGFSVLAIKIQYFSMNLHFKRFLNASEHLNQLNKPYATLIKLVSIPKLGEKKMRLTEIEFISSIGLNRFKSCSQMEAKIRLIEL